MQKSDLIVTDHALERARLLGVDGEGHEYGLTGAVMDLVDTAAPITHPKGNQVNGIWILSVKAGAIVSIHRIQCEDCLDRKRIQVWEECPGCHGAGCKKCRTRGEVLRLIPCQSCTYQTKTQGGNYEEHHQESEAPVEPVARGNHHGQ